MRHFWPAQCLCLALCACGNTTDIVGARGEGEGGTGGSPVDPGPDNAIEKRLGVPKSTSDALIRTAYEQLYFGNEETEAVYRDVGDVAYIEDVFHQDVRTDSIGYGMFVAVQLDEQVVFDKLWAWAKLYMLHTEPPLEGLLSWVCSPAGDNCANVAATDATSVIATTLFMAHGRWAAPGHPYLEDANSLVDALVLTEQRNGGIVDNVANPFDVVLKLPRRTSSASEQTLVQSDYLMPAFYEYWSGFRSEDAVFWREAATASQDLLRRLPTSDTGLFAKVVEPDGTPVPGEDYYDDLAARALLNRWFCQAFTGPQPWVLEQNGRLLDFFLSEGDYVSEYDLDGSARTMENTTVHRVLAATAAAYSDNPDAHNVFLQALLDEPIPTDQLRYFKGMLYLISLLAVSGGISR